VSEQADRPPQVEGQHPEAEVDEVAGERKAAGTREAEGTFPRAGHRFDPRSYRLHDDMHRPRPRPQPAPARIVRDHRCDARHLGLRAQVS
jgi:hypothetical protein